MRKAGSNSQETWPAIRQAAIDLLVKHGYEAMNLRELAAMCGMQAGSLYNYFSSKQELLYRLITETMQSMLGDLDRALEPIADPVPRLERFIELMVHWHAVRRDETFMGHMELRSLPPEQFKSYAELRRRFEQILLAIIRLGRRQGEFSVSDERIAVLAIIQSLTGICHWYEPGGRLSVKRLTRIYTQMILAQLKSGSLKAVGAS